MGYIAKTPLFHGGRFIKVGEEVPPTYKRFAEGIKRGWIEETGDPAAPPPPVEEPETVLPPTISDPMPEQLAATSDTAPPLLIEDAACVNGSIIVPEEPPEHAGHVIEDIGYLNPMARKSLAEKNIVTIRDIAGWDVEALDELRGIGVSLAERLLADFEKWKESFSEYVPLEDEDVASDTGETEESSESGEDEGPEDD